ncbi:MAG: hypothetical protein KF736_02715 [Acidobacteria bacterium]|nr:hypothetical protein [Acidobacteriota bacterium]MCW5949320.1 hypothetical protein [Pyrinomonadaceae bacterium]
MKDLLPQVGQTRLEQVASVAVILAAIGLIVFVAKSLTTTISGQPGRSLPSAPKLGDVLEINGKPLIGDRPSLVFVLSTTCRFCMESTDFYRRLFQERDPAKLAFVALIYENAESATEYFKGRSLLFDSVAKAEPGTIRHYGTPTLILVDAQGKVIHSWVGKLSDAQEKEVRDSLLKAARSEFDVSSVFAISRSLRS